jgi:hypothetical protein
MRNRHGTGHGRAAATGITEEHAELAYDSALLRSGWALRRLEPYIAGDVNALIQDLAGEIFTRGKLRRRLDLVNLAHLSPQDQMRLGVAVARRASEKTFVVIEDGVEAVQSNDPGAWPLAYVEGLIVGLFFDRNGYPDLEDWKVSEIARIVGSLADPMPLLEELTQRVEGLTSSLSVAVDEQDRRELVDAFVQASDQLPNGGPRQRWLTIAQRLGSDASA